MGEAPSEVVLADHDPVVRALLAERDEVDTVAIAPSSPLGIEWLPRDEAQPLLDASHDGILELGDPFRLWAAPALAAPAAGAGEIDGLLDRGALGACVPAAALAGEAGRKRMASLLSRLQARDAVLFVHPGPARSASDLEPSWWPALTAYGPRTVDAVLRVVGVDRLVYGSDRPVVEPPELEPLGTSFSHAVREANPALLLSLDPVPV